MRSLGGLQIAIVCDECEKEAQIKITAPLPDGWLEGKSAVGRAKDFWDLLFCSEACRDAWQAEED